MNKKANDSINLSFDNDEVPKRDFGDQVAKQVANQNKPTDADFS